MNGKNRTLFAAAALLALPSLAFAQPRLATCKGGPGIQFRLLLGQDKQDGIRIGVIYDNFERAYLECVDQYDIDYPSFATCEGRSFFGGTMAQLTVSREQVADHQLTAIYTRKPGETPIALVCTIVEQ